MAQAHAYTRDKKLRVIANSGNSTQFMYELVEIAEGNQDPKKRNARILLEILRHVDTKNAGSVGFKDEREEKIQNRRAGSCAEPQAVFKLIQMGIALENIIIEQFVSHEDRYITRCDNCMQWISQNFEIYVPEEVKITLEKKYNIMLGNIFDEGKSWLKSNIFEDNLKKALAPEPTTEAGSKKKKKKKKVLLSFGF